MLNDFGIHGMLDGWKIVIGGKMGTVPAIAQELAVSVPSDDVPKYLAAVLRAYKEKAKPDERLAKTIERIDFTNSHCPCRPFNRKELIGHFTAYSLTDRNYVNYQMFCIHIEPPS